MSMEEVGHSEFQSLRAQISGLGYSSWPLVRNCKSVLRMVSVEERKRHFESLADFIIGDQLCGVGLSVRFNSHLISVWHRDGANQKSIDALLETVLQELPVEMKPKPDNYFYKKHSDHVGFKAPAPDATPAAADAPKA
jgi:hypothetical protein